jgi:sulfoxide reductase catalytic subunit YedY
MGTRRQFIRKIFVLVGGFLLSWIVGIHKVLSKAAKILLPRGTPLESLIQKNPADLDTRNLSVIPLKEFETMGLTDHTIDTEIWRLDIHGLVKNPLRLPYAELLKLPAIEREVLLICPGFFANHGLWCGISLGALLRRAGVSNTAKKIVIQGPEGPFKKTADFPVQDVLSDRVFLAHHVNGVPLPIKHGYPIRVVAEGFYGYDWVKYATFVQAE